MNSAITNDESNYVVKQIGSTQYKIRVHFSETAKENMEDKLFRLIKNEALYTSKQSATEN